MVTPVIKVPVLAASLLLWPCSCVFAAPPETHYLPAADQLDRLSQPPAESHRAETQHITNRDLADNPELAKALLDEAVAQGRWAVVREILPVYAATPHPDATLVLFAGGGLARSEGHHALAIARYRDILSEHPELAAVRLELARTLYENNQVDIAQYHFRRVLRTHPPENVQYIIAQYLERMQKKGTLSGSVNLSYLNDSNVNNASSGDTIRIGNREFIRNKDSFPQRGEGVSFSAALQKDLPLFDQHSLRFLGTVYGKDYWNNHDYDDITSRVYAGYLWRNYRQQFAALPFFEKRWYGTDAYSSGPGVRLEYSYLISPKWQVSQAMEYQKLGYDNQDYAFLRGYTRYASTTLSHALNPRVMLSGGVDLLEQQTSTASESNHRAGVRAAVQVDLPWKISFSALGAFSQRHYEDDNDIFAVRRRDNEQFYHLAVWHRDLHFLGMMPKLNLSEKRVNSNIDFYSYRQHSITLSVDKNF